MIVFGGHLTGGSAGRVSGLEASVILALHQAPPYSCPCSLCHSSISPLIMMVLIGRAVGLEDSLKVFAGRVSGQEASVILALRQGPPYSCP